MKRAALCLTILVLLLPALLLSGCSLRNDPPSPEEARAFLDQNREDIETVAAYLLSLKYDRAAISKKLNSDPGEVFYAFEYHDIASEEIEAAVNRLWRAGCTNMEKNDQKGNNTVSFTIWSRTRGEMDCGIAFTIDGQGLPRNQFQTRCEEIGDGWFYYITAYEEYRSHPAKYAEYQPNDQTAPRKGMPAEIAGGVEPASPRPPRETKNSRTVRYGSFLAREALLTAASGR